MGISPAIAVPKMLEAAGLKKEEVDIYEVDHLFLDVQVLRSTDS
jgi:acetyl-CoA acetyltransferase